MRISDWSSDVCSSDLRHALFDARLGIAPPMITQRVQPRRQDPGRRPSRLVDKKRGSAPAFQVWPGKGSETLTVSTIQEITPPEQFTPGKTSTDVPPRLQRKLCPDPNVTPPNTER